MTSKFDRIMRAATKATSLNTAVAIAGRYTDYQAVSHCVVMGDDMKFWIVKSTHAVILVASGYEMAWDYLQRNNA
ncbi:MAG: hypothetical protein GY847_14310 [Proteobacteria bacterium]|nr:hypothetical protein [Pseudomonadota bacterium]